MPQPQRDVLATRRCRHSPDCGNAVSVSRCSIARWADSISASVTCVGSIRRGLNPISNTCCWLERAVYSGERVIRLRCMFTKMTPAGLEPASPGSVGRCLIHWATGPVAVCHICANNAQLDVQNIQRHTLPPRWASTCDPRVFGRACS